MSRTFLAISLALLLGACAEFGNTPVNYLSSVNQGFADDNPPAGPRSMQWRSPTGEYPVDWRSGPGGP